MILLMKAMALACAIQLHASPAGSMKFLLQSPDYVQAAQIPGVKVRLKYAETDNFMHENLYGDFKICFLHKDSAAMLKQALVNLKKAHPHYDFLIYDALRPRSVQRKMWARVKGTPSQKYVADPDKGSMHNYGLALDLTVINKEGKPLDMGAGYDDFREISEPRHEAEFLKSGQLTQAQMANRLILRHAMEGAGFIQLKHEWWHFDAMEQKKAQAIYKIVE
ncbi:MAG: M15 family metallopeptidase [candidate division FCPU426 bacterium]